jgi:hypothetical protein
MVQRQLECRRGRPNKQCGEHGNSKTGFALYYFDLRLPRCWSVVNFDVSRSPLSKTRLWVPSTEMEEGNRGMTDGPRVALIMESWRVCGHMV